MGILKRELAISPDDRYLARARLQVISQIRGRAAIITFFSGRGTANNSSCGTEH